MGQSLSDLERGFRQLKDDGDCGRSIIKIEPRVKGIFVTALALWCSGC